MLQIMLCGAHDTSNFQEQFSEVVKNFGGDFRYYQLGTITSENNLFSNFSSNSAETVKNVDICVFLINESYGEITWKTEFITALNNAKEILILINKDTLGKYYSVRMKKDSHDNDNWLIDVINDINDRNLTMVPFADADFSDVLTYQLSSLFQKLLVAYSIKRRHHNAIEALKCDAVISQAMFITLKETALDEEEEKGLRKAALRQIVSYNTKCKQKGGDSNIRALEPDDIICLLKSYEQGIYRLTLDLFPDLIESCKIVPDDFFDDIVTIINDCDDVGAGRRFVRTILDYDFVRGVRCLAGLNIRDDIGLRHRLSDMLIKHKSEIMLNKSLQAEVLELARECIEQSKTSDWQKNCKDFITELEQNLGAEQETN